MECKCTLDARGNVTEFCGAHVQAYHTYKRAYDRAVSVVDMPTNTPTIEYDQDRQDLVRALDHVSRLLTTAAQELRKCGALVMSDMFATAATYGREVADRPRK